MEIKCPYCDEMTTGNEGQLTRCTNCKKVFEIKNNTAVKAEPEKKITKQAQVQRHRPPVDLSETEYYAGLQIAQLVTFFAYFMLALVALVILVGAFQGFVLRALASSVGIIFFAMSLLLFSHTSKAVMKSADYLRIIARQMNDRD